MKRETVCVYGATGGVKSIPERRLLMPEKKKHTTKNSVDSDRVEVNHILTSTSINCVYTI